MSPAYEITSSPQEIDHNLGTEDVLVQVWVNGYAVQADARIENENTVVVGLAQPFDSAKAIIEPATAKPTRHVKESSDGNQARGEGDPSSDEGGSGASGKGASRR